MSNTTATFELTNQRYRPDRARRCTVTKTHLSMDALNDRRRMLPPMRQETACAGFDDLWAVCTIGKSIYRTPLKDTYWRLMMRTAPVYGTPKWRAAGLHRRGKALCVVFLGGSESD